MPPSLERHVLDLRKFGIPEAPALGRYQYSKARGGLTLHSHPGALEVCYLAKGRQLYRVGNRDYVLRGGDVFVTFPGEKHSTGESPEEKGILYWLEIRLPKHGKFLNCSPQDAKLLIAQLLAMPHRHFAGSPELKSMLDGISAVCQRRGDALRHITIQNKLVEFLLGVISCSRQQLKPGMTPLISGLLRHIEANIHEPLSVGELAELIKLSMPRFKARFKQEVGIPPAEYVMRCKLDVAKQMLARGGRSITEVAFELNFSSSQYFATVVRRYLGCPPRDLLPDTTQRRA